MVKDLVDFIDNEHPVLTSMGRPTEILPGIYRVTFSRSDKPGSMEVEFRVKR